MKYRLLAGCSVALLPLLAAAQPGNTLQYPGVGNVAIERPAGEPRSFVIFLSGDGGWSQGVVAMAHRLAEDGALVAGVDVPQMARQQASHQGSCVRSAELLEGLSHFAQQRLGLKDYLAPVLVGYSSGATLAYATLVQAPPGTFRGAVTLGFCPDLEWSKPLCRGEGLEHDVTPGKVIVYRAAAGLRDPWVALQGGQDQVCDPAGTRDFVRQVPGGELVMLPKVGHGYSVERNWLPQFMDAYRKVAGSAGAGRPALPADVDDLPLIELRPSRGERDVVAIMLSGDGGWAGLDREVAAELNARGVPVVGWDSLRYFWNARTPGEAASDLARVIEHYTLDWRKSRVLVIGYSQGADVLPFMINRLPADARDRIASTALIALSREAFFEFSVNHWISTPTGGLPILPELRRGLIGRVNCIYGNDEQDTSCRESSVPGLRGVALPGGHHFDGDYARVAAAVLAGLPATMTAPPGGDPG